MNIHVSTFNQDLISSKFQCCVRQQSMYGRWTWRPLKAKTSSYHQEIIDFVSQQPIWHLFLSGHRRSQKLFYQ